MIDRQSAQPRPEVLIVGAGAIGCSIAYALALRGQRNVLVVDRGRAGSGSSGRATGGLRAQFSTEINVRFTLLSQPFFQQARALLGADIGYHEPGYIFLARSDAQAAQFQRNVDLQRGLGVAAHWLGVEELADRWGYLRFDGVTAGAWCPTDALFDQVRYMDALAARVRDLGVEIREDVNVTALLTDGGRVTGVETGSGPIEAGVTILAAGAWSPLLAATVGLTLPIDPARREIYTFSDIPAVPRNMPFVADFDIGSYIRREVDGFRVSGKLAPGVDPESEIDMAAAGDALAWATTLLPALAPATATGGWAGLTEITPDHHALLGVVPGLEGLIVATGFSGHGLMHAPATGQLVAELLLDGAATTLDITPLAPDRFERGAALAETMIARQHEQGDVGSGGNREPGTGT